MLLIWYGSFNWHGIMQEPLVANIIEYLTNEEM